MNTNHQLHTSPCVFQSTIIPSGGFFYVLFNPAWKLSSINLPSLVPENNWGWSNGKHLPLIFIFVLSAMHSATEVAVGLLKCEKSVLQIIMVNICDLTWCFKFMGKYNPGVQLRLGSDWLGNSSVESDLGVLVTTSSIWVTSVLLRRWKPRWRWAASTRAFPAETKKSLTHPTQHLSGHTWNTAVSFGDHYTKKIWRGWTGSREGRQRWSKERAATIEGRAERTGFVQPWEKKA